ncbi:MAG: 50S ribosomal protein L5 [Candidatus Marinimicrobia bacterium]|nr:50S ribosomal protein L5 [Candidatus Neomarinimicrobiota bacterium]
MASRLQEKYEQQVKPALQAANQYANPMQVPRIKKVVVNMGVKTSLDKDALQILANDLGKITGQKPVIAKSRLSIANFRLREGMPVGIKVTLRGQRMYEFLDRLINTALPRIRDFRGISATGFDGRGNFSLGLREQTIFPEIDPDKIKATQGMNITIVTDAASDAEARELLRGLGMPFAAAQNVGRA